MSGPDPRSPWGSRRSQARRSDTAEVERESLRLTLDELAIDQADFAGWSVVGQFEIGLEMEAPPEG